MKLIYEEDVHYFNLCILEEVREDSEEKLCRLMSEFGRVCEEES